MSVPRLEKLEQLWSWLKEQALDECACDIEVCDIQNKAHEIGLLKIVPYDPKKHGDSDYCEPGEDWFVDERTQP